LIRAKNIVVAMLNRSSNEGRRSKAMVRTRRVVVMVLALLLMVRCIDPNGLREKEVGKRRSRRVWAGEEESV
jgi:hypothetical protein